MQGVTWYKMVFYESDFENFDANAHTNNVVVTVVDCTRVGDGFHDLGVEHGRTKRMPIRISVVHEPLQTSSILVGLQNWKNVVSARHYKVA